IQSAGGGAGLSVASAQRAAAGAFRSGRGGLGCGVAAGTAVRGAARRSAGSYRLGIDQPARSAAPGNRAASGSTAGGGRRTPRPGALGGHRAGHGRRGAGGVGSQAAGGHLIMSKIEEALRRARAERAGEPTADGARDEVRDGWGDGERQKPAASRGALIGLTAAEEIAHMREERPYGPAELAQRRIIDKEMTDPRVADAFRQLRTSLLQKSGDRN